MKILGIDVVEHTTPKPGVQTWNPIKIKILQTAETLKIIGDQLTKQTEYYKANDHVSYKFVIKSDKWLFEGCFLQDVTYVNMDMTGNKYDSIEMNVRFDNLSNLS